MKLIKSLFISTVLLGVTACTGLPYKNTKQSDNCHHLVQEVDANNASAGDELLNLCLQKSPSKQKEPEQSSNIWLNSLGEFVAQALNSLSEYL